MKCGNVFNSICCVVCFLSIVSLAVIVSVGVYLIIFSISYQLAYDNSDRTRLFEKMETEMERSLLAISEVCERIEGTQRQFAEWTVEGEAIELERLISFYFPYIQIVVELMGKSMTFGIWTHISTSETQRILPAASSEFLEHEKQVSFYFDYGQYIFTNVSNSHELEIESRSSYGHDLFTNYTVTKITPPRYTDTPHAFYMTKHKQYEYWLSGDMPYMSFSIGSGPYSDLGNITVDQYYAGNIWFGKTIADFSDFLSSITPSGSGSWLIETNLDYLLAVSDYDKPEDLFSDTFFSPSEYTHNPTIQKFSKKLPYLLPGIKSGEITSVTFDGTHFLIRYFHWDKGTVPTDWVLVNSKPVWSIYRLSYLTIMIVSLFCLFLLCMGCCWCMFVIRVIFDLDILRREMKKIDSMKLDRISFPCTCCSFLEISFLRNRFMKMVSILQEYKAFLPEILLDDDGHDAAISSSSSEEDTRNVLNSRKANHSSTTSSYHRRRSIAVGNSDEEEEEEEEEDLHSRGSDGSSSSGSSHNGVNSGGTSSNSSEESVIFSKGSNPNKFSIGINETELLAVMIDFEHGKSISEIYDCVISSLSTKPGLLYDFDVHCITIIMVKKVRESYGMMIIEHLRKSLEKKNLLDKVRFLMSKDRGIVGNLGNSRMKKFCFSGDVKKNLQVMKDSIPYMFNNNNVSGGSVFVCENCYVALDEGYILRLVDPEHYHFELGKSKFVKDNEWMYMLEEQENLKYWVEYNKATDSYEEGEYEKAKRWFIEFVEKSGGGDILSTRWIDLCDRKTEEKRKCMRYIFLEEKFKLEEKEEIEDPEKTNN